MLSSSQSLFYVFWTQLQSLKIAAQFNTHPPSPLVFSDSSFRVRIPKLQSGSVFGRPKRRNRPNFAGDVALSDLHQLPASWPIFSLGHAAVVVPRDQTWTRWWDPCLLPGVPGENMAELVDKNMVHGH